MMFKYVLSAAHMLCIPLLVNQAQRSYVSSTTRMRCLRAVLSIMAQMVRGEEELLNKVIIFLFSLCTKSILVASSSCINNVFVLMFSEH